MVSIFFLSLIFFTSYTSDRNAAFDGLLEDADRQLAQICITNEISIDITEESKVTAKKKMVKKAIKRDDEHKLIRLLKEDTPTSMKGLLHYAIDQNSSKSLHILLQEGADVNQRYKNGYPLGCAIQWCDAAMTFALLDAGAEPELIDQQGNTALHIACKKGSLAIVDRLMDQYHASLVARNHSQMTPLHCAAEGGNVDILLTLLCKGPCEVREKNGATPLMIALANDHAVAALALLTAGACVVSQDNDGDTPLHYAMTHNALVVQALLAHHADVSKKNKKGNNPLHVLIAKRPLPEEYEQMISFLLDAHTPVDGPNDEGETPLLIALFCNHEHVAEILLHKGADPNLAMPKADRLLGFTPLHIAINKGLCKIVSLLLEKGADPFVRMPNGQLSLHIAKKHMIRKLLRRAMQKWSSSSSVASLCPE